MTPPAPATSTAPQAAAPTGSTPPAPGGAVPNPAELLRSKQYVVLLVLAAILGAVAAAVVLFYLKLVGLLQHFFYHHLVSDLGFKHEPLWWPLPLLVIAGLLVALTIQYLPGTGGEEPAEGLKVSLPRPVELFGIVLASLATLGFGAVLGPEAPLILIGAGLGVTAMRVIRRDAPQQAVLVVGLSCSFAAVSTLLGNPLIGAFLMLEVIGAGAGAMLNAVLIPGLLASGVGALTMVGIGKWTGFGTFSLALKSIPPFHTPTAVEFLWAIAIGILAGLFGTVIHRAAIGLQRVVEPRKVLLTPVIGAVVALAAIIFCAISDKSSSLVLFSGQSALPTLLHNAAAFSAGTVVLLAACKAIAYAASLSSFRGGPIFPSMLIGAAGGVALSHIGGLPAVAGAAMGVGAMIAVMLGQPLIAALLAAVLFVADGLSLVPLIIVAVVVAYVVRANLIREPTAASQEAAAPPARPAGTKADGKPKVGKPASV
jgi:H+/Cl- antiporter ClcA